MAIGTLRYLTSGKPTVFPNLPPRENKCFPDPFPVRFLSEIKTHYIRLCSRQESNLHRKLRKLASYPLNDESIQFKDTTIIAKKSPAVIICYNKLMQNNSSSNDALEELKREIQAEEREERDLEKQEKILEADIQKLERELDKKKAELNQIKAKANHLKSEKQRRQQELSRLSRGVNH